LVSISELPSDEPGHVTGRLGRQAVQIGFSRRWRVVVRLVGEVARETIVESHLQSARAARLDELAHDVAVAAPELFELGDVMRGQRAVVERDALGVLHGQHQVGHARRLRRVRPLAAVEFVRVEQRRILIAAGPIDVRRGAKVEMHEHAEAPRHEIALRRAQGKCGHAPGRSQIGTERRRRKEASGGK
jgi:hypothetical protein